MGGPLTIARRPRGALVALLAIAALTVTTTQTASAGAIAELPTPFHSAQPMRSLVPGAAGSMWFVQSIVETNSTHVGIAPDAVADRMRVGWFSASGELHIFSEVPGSGWHTALAVDPSGGGAWTVTRYGNGWGRLAHWTADGSRTIPAMPDGIVAETLGVDAAGRAWVVGCPGAIHPAGSPCQAHRVTATGTVESFALPASANMAGGSLFTDRSVVPVEGGVWITPTVGSGGVMTFISDDGQIRPVALSPSARLLGPADGSGVWWRDDSGQVAVAAPNGTISGVRPPAPSAFVRALAGSRNNVLWSQDIADSDLDGRVGVYGAAGDRAFDVVSGRVSVPVETATSTHFTGRCSFGVEIVEAPDGALWTLSGGHPTLLSRQGLDGDFRTMLPPSLLTAAGGSVHDGAMSHLRMSTTGQLWLAVTPVDSPTRFALINPLDPPPGMRSFAAASKPPPAKQAPARKVTRAEILAQLRRDIRPSGRRARLSSAAKRGYASRPRGLVKGKLTVVWSARVRDRMTLIARGTSTFSGPGKGRLTVKPTAAGRKVMRRHRKLAVRIAGTFAASGQRPVSASLRITLRR